MNRLHVHLNVQNLAQSVRFYSALFGAEPTKHEADYAKWMLEDPRVNFAISSRSGEAGLSHLGIQVEDTDELANATARAKQAAGQVLVEEGRQLLLREERQELGRGSAGRALGNFPDRGRHHQLRHRRRRDTS